VILEVHCEGRELAVEVTENAGAHKLKVDGQEAPCDFLRLANGHYSLIVNGCVYDFTADFSEGKCLLAGCDGSWLLKVADARRLALQRDATEGQAGLQRLTAEMPGKVIRVLVAPGDTVAYEQGLLVLEAMKMQNEIRAPKAGIVREIKVCPGATVSTGEFLLSIE
jgi:acetyl/propionyl-CoA carboxylase alpha subunit